MSDLPDAPEYGEKGTGREVEAKADDCVGGMYDMVV